jgi:precorrin-6B methylase 2
MSAAEPFAASAVSARRLAMTIPVFVTALFLSAFLLFAVQPMFTKMVLPKLGGTPGVWSVAMVFFQGVLLVGYGYAHLLTSRLEPRRAALVHIVVMGLVLAVALPIGLSANVTRPPADGEALWLIGVFALSVGLPFFAISANGPLLQAWFARTGHPHAQDPYFLYGASNIGSLLALLAYPVLIEPTLTLSTQSRAWTWGFALLIACIAAAAAFAVNGRTITAPAAQTAPAAGAERISWAQRGRWTGYAFVPSALLVAVTAHLSTDVAAAPFLWVIPLSLFLVTFIVTFQRKPILPHESMLRLQPVAVALPALSAAGAFGLDWAGGLVLHLAGFFVAAMVCHGELVRRRPGAANLTEFYLWMSVGGVVGGLFAGLIAPHVFSTVAEYPLLLVASLLCRPGLFDPEKRVKHGREAALVLGVTLVAFAPKLLFGYVPQSSGVDPAKVLAVVVVAALLFSAAHPARIAALLAASVALVAVYQESLSPPYSLRSFFGVHRVMESADGRFRILAHGTTIHGAQMLRTADGALVEGEPEPLTYYFTEGGIAQALLTTRAARGGRLGEVAIVGVGTGSMACHHAKGEAWTYYDIDPDVVRIARDPKLFNFVGACTPNAPIVLGDARLTLADSADKRFDVLVIDAFSSDAIPVHLMTREAVSLYMSKLAEGGILIMHISNRNMELASVVTAIAAAEGLSTIINTPRKTPEQAAELKVPPHVAVIARAPGDLDALAAKLGWRRSVPNAAVRPWTDDYADIISAIWRQYRR